MNPFTSPTGAAVALPAATRSLLVVDDSATVRHMLSSVLTAAGWHVLLARDGRHALDTVAAQAVDLVITDLNMPEMDGIALIRELRGRPALAALPILVLTTDMDEATKLRARAAGASGWIGKPVDGAAIADIVQALLA